MVSRVTGKGNFSWSGSGKDKMEGPKENLRGLEGDGSECKEKVTKLSKRRSTEGFLYSSLRGEKRRVHETA